MGNIYAWFCVTRKIIYFSWYDVIKIYYVAIFRSAQLEQISRRWAKFGCNRNERFLRNRCQTHTHTHTQSYKRSYTLTFFAIEGVFLKINVPFFLFLTEMVTLITMLTLILVSIEFFENYLNFSYKLSPIPPTPPKHPRALLK